MLKEVDFHRPGGACRDAELTTVAPFRFEKHLPGFSVEIEGGGRAEGRAGAAVDAFVDILAHALGKRFHVESQSLEVADAVVEIFPLATQFKNQDAFPSGENPCLENIQQKVVAFDQLVDDRFIREIGRVADDHFT